jgi:hypothetical protein
MGALQIAIIIVAAAAAVGGFLAVQNFLNSFTSIDHQLMQIASELNKTCPIYVDRETRLDNTEARQGMTLVYNYTLVNMMLEDINIPDISTRLRPQIVNHFKTSNEMKRCRDMKVTFIYKYKDKTGRFAFEIKVTPEDYR